MSGAETEDQAIGAPGERSPDVKNESTAEARQAHAAEIRKVVQDIVSQVRAGVTAEGLGLVQVELKEGILGGAQLTLTGTKDGLAVKFDTRDKQAQDLLDQLKERWNL